MRRTIQWTGLLVTVVVIAFLIWPTQADAGLTVESTAFEPIPERGPAPVVIVTNEQSGRVVFGIENVEVRSERHPEVPMSMELQWRGGAGMSVREGLGIRLRTHGQVDGSLAIRTQQDVLVRIETTDGAEIAALELRTPTLANVVVIEW